MYKFWGKVRIHNRRGKELGFPTANVNLNQSISEGIYVSKTKMDGKLYKSVTFIGAAKTFGETTVQSETYILNFKKNIYGKWISVELLKRLRGNKKFDNVKDLVTQMQKDEEAARHYFEPKMGY